MKLSGVNLHNLNVAPVFKRQAAPVFSPVYDTVSFSGAPAVKYVDENIPLLDGYSLKPIRGSKDFVPGNIVMVHMTNYFPSDGEIKPVNIAAKDENGKAPYRSTVHFALNHSVNEHMWGGQWQHMQYALILPMDGVLKNTKKENLIGGGPEDMFIMGRVKLPDNSIIIKYNPDIQTGRMKITDASKTLPDFYGTKGIKIIETSDKNTGAFANKAVEKMGYSSVFGMLKNISGLSDDEIRACLGLDFDREISDDEIDNILDGLDEGKIEKADDEISKGWKNLFNKNDLTLCKHSYSPWGRSEMLIEGVKLAALNSDTWKKVLFETPKYEVIMFDETDISKDDILSSVKSAHDDANTVDYKKEFLTVIDEIKRALPKGKKLSFDIDVLREIIEKAETPLAALKEIENRLNLKPMIPIENYGNDMSESEIYNTLDMLICIGEEQKSLCIPGYGES